MVGLALPHGLLSPGDDVIEDGTLRVRLATPADGDACAAIYAPYVVRTSISFELVPPGGEDMAGRIERTIGRSPWLVVEVDGIVRAYAYGTRHRERAAYDWTIETAVYVDEAFRGRGLGRAVMRALIAVVRLQGFHLALTQLQVLEAIRQRLDGFAGQEPVVLQQPFVQQAVHQGPAVATAL
jgi:phosphinothricin acetyltransferase